jgi:hypothetical protein
MNERTKEIVNIIYQAIDNLSDEEEYKELPKDPDTVLMGKNSSLGSLTVVRLIIETESLIDEKYDIDVSTFASDKMLSEKHSPLRSIGALADFIARILEEQGK